MIAWQNKKLEMDIESNTCTNFGVSDTTCSIYCMSDDFDLGKSEGPRHLLKNIYFTEYM